MTSQPNFLVVQADQLTTRALAAYGSGVAKTPNIDRLARTGVVFERSFCNYPLCGPSRASMMTGRLPSRIGVYDNGGEFPASMPTFLHYLRLQGYRTTLAGKMHFIGPDQLHGFERRLTSDIYPSDFNWTASWRTSGTTAGGRLLAAAGEAQGVKAAGVYERTVQLDYDEEVAFKAVREIWDVGRGADRRPFCLVASFTHPHDPYAVPRRFWDLYDGVAIPDPSVPAMPPERLDPMSRRLYDHIGVARAGLTAEDVRYARRAYYGAVSYVDEKLGQLLDALKANGLRDDTVVVFVSDHGEALGERGLWFKRSLLNPAVQVPMIFNAPKLFGAGRCDRNVSLVDLFPTLVDFAGLPPSDLSTAVDGQSLRGLLGGEDPGWRNIVLSEQTSEGTTSPCTMVVDGDLKLILCETDPPQLYDLRHDPLELDNLAPRGDLASTVERLTRVAAANWQVGALTAAILDSQARRRLVDLAHSHGAPVSWDYDLVLPGSGQYFRPSPANPSASNYNDDFEVRIAPGSTRAVRRDWPPCGA